MSREYAVMNREYVVLKQKPARYWRLMPIILTTLEAEHGRIKVSSWPQANSSQDPISKTPNTKKG
jgi:hypothetical protein